MTRIQPRVLALSLAPIICLVAPEARASPCGHEFIGHLDEAELRIRRNEVFARHGRAFKSPDLQAHFGAQPWYRIDPEYTDARLTPDDQACIERVKRWESPSSVTRLAEDLDGSGSKNRIAVLDSRPEGEDTCSPEDLVCEIVIVIDGFAEAIPGMWQRGAYFGTLEVDVIDIDQGDRRRELRVSQLADWYEDPPKKHTIFRLTPTLHSIKLSGHGYSGGTLRVPGDGRVGLEDLDCTDSQTRHIVRWFRVKPTSVLVLEKLETAVEHSFPGCAACPYLEQLVDGEWHARGEVLRYMDSPDHSEWEQTSLFHAGGDLVLRLSERKHEVTHLDAIKLQTVQGEFLPVDCTEGSPEWCEADGIPHLLHEGDEMEIRFQLPPESLGRVELHVTGFYQPL